MPDKKEKKSFSTDEGGASSPFEKELVGAEPWVQKGCYPILRPSKKNPETIYMKKRGRGGGDVYKVGAYDSKLFDILKDKADEVKKGSSKGGEKKIIEKLRNTPLDKKKPFNELQINEGVWLARLETLVGKHVYHASITHLKLSKEDQMDASKAYEAITVFFDDCLTMKEDAHQLRAVETQLAYTGFYLDNTIQRLKFLQNVYGVATTVMCPDCRNNVLSTLATQRAAELTEESERGEEVRPTGMTA